MFRLFFLYRLRGHYHQLGQRTDAADSRSDAGGPWERNVAEWIALQTEKDIMADGPCPKMSVSLSEGRFTNAAY